MSDKPKELTSDEIRSLFIIVQNELNNIKKQHADDKAKLENSIKELKEELEKKDKEIKSLKKTIDNLMHSKNIESSKSLNKSVIHHKDSKPLIAYTEEEIKYINVFNQKYDTKISGNEKIIDLSKSKSESENENLISKIRTYKEKDAENIVKLFNENYNSLIGDLFNGLKSTNFI